MKTLTRCPAIVDRERCEADYKDVLLEFGRKPPNDMGRRDARAKQLKRVLAVHSECQKLDDLSRRTIPSGYVLHLPVVRRPSPKGYREIYPTRDEIKAHRAKLFRKPDSKA